MVPATYIEKCYEITPFNEETLHVSYMYKNIVNWELLLGN